MLTEGVDLWATDEVHFQQYGSRCRMGVPPEIKDPTLLHHPGLDAKALATSGPSVCGTASSFIEAKTRASADGPFAKMTHYLMHADKPASQPANLSSSPRRPTVEEWP